MAVSTLFFVGATAIAATALWPLYESVEFLLMAGVTVGVAATIAIIGARYRWPGPVMVGVTVATFFAVGVPLAVPSSAIQRVLPSGEGILELLRGAALGWRQLLTITLPVGSYQALLVPAFLLLLVTVIVGLSIALRFEAGELATLAPTLVLILGLAFGPRDAPFAVPLALAFLTAVLAWSSWRRWYRRREGVRALAASPSASGSLERIGGTRTAIAAVIILGIAVSVGGASAITAPLEGDRSVLRDAVEQPFDPREHSSPLSGFRKYHQSALADATILTVDGLPEGSRIRVATLDTYDGVVFTVGSAAVTSASGSFTRLPTAIDREAEAGAPAELTIELGDYEGIWLPTVGLLSSVDFRGATAASHTDSFFFNEVSGAGVVLDGLRAGDRYLLDTVISEQPARGEVSNLRPGSATVPPALVVPDELTVVLDTWVREANTPGDRLSAMLAGLAAEGYVSHGVDDDEPLSRSGHGADRIQELLSASRMIGDEEQYAVTAALMARAIGFPSRVVFGFAPEASEGDRTVVRGHDVSAWIEVDTTQHGWVAIDPTPPDREIPEQEPEEPTQVARPQSPVPPPVVEPDPARDQAPLDTTQEDENAEDPLLAALLAALVVLGWIGLAILIVLAPFLAILIAKLRRRHVRQYAASAAARVSGGWREFEDIVADYGYTAPPSPTRSEVAEAVGGIRPLVLASVADRAVFAPEQVHDDEARQIWVAVRELEESIASTRTRWQRVKATVSLRSLAGYSLKELFSRERRLP